MRQILTVSALAILLAGCGMFTSEVPLPSGPTLTENLAQPGTRADPEAARAWLNAYRRGKGLPEVAVDAKLMRMAEEQARAMAAENKLGHTLASTGEFRSRLGRSGYEAGNAAENVSAGYFTVADAFGGWRRSSGHNTNLLLANAKHMGIAVAQAPGTRYKAYWALVVAAPAASRREVVAEGGPFGASWPGLK